MHSRSSFLVLGIAVSAVMMQPVRADLSDDIERLQMARDEAVAKATAPIDKKFRESLEALMKRATQAGDLEAANAIKAKIEELRPKGVEVLEGTTWASKNHNTVIHFKKGGKMIEEWSGGPSENSWKRVSPKEVKVTSKSTGKEFKFTLNEAGDEIKREGDGLTWKLQPAEAK
ncbi:MAG: hypothetical protein EOP87_14015 [Verrucomicrobiaceae bacterium]|nr:MAG: hypothetical protein EOP87_14015 [Verrucomicrobiaceae bacterium]